jgi:Fe-Mn family superoxide dismutase
MHGDEQRGVNRRTAIGVLGAAGVVGVSSAGVLGASPLGGARSVLGPPDLGWDATKGEYALPPLPYAANALEPYIDAQTMTIHHDKHHAAYVAGANKALKALAGVREGQTDPALVKFWSRELAFHGSGHFNHTLFWQTMAPPPKGDGPQAPSGDLASALNRDFGSFEKFVAHFKAAAVQVEGSGWGWLVYQPMSGRLLVLQGEKQQDMTIWGVTPLLGVDVWEHAYYLKYQNRRTAYVDAFMNVINWGKVGEIYQRVKG